MRLKSRLIAFPAALACTDSKTPGESGGSTVATSDARFGAITYSAQAIVRPDGRSGPSVASTLITYTNTGTQPVELLLPAGCFVSLRLQAVRGGATWDQQQWRRQSLEQTGFALACADTARGARLAPGARTSFVSDEAPQVLDILGDSLQEGEYEVIADVLPPQGAPGGRVSLPAGRVRLTRR